MKKENSIAEKTKNFIRPIVEGLGYELVDVDYEKTFNGYQMTVYIDKPQDFVFSGKIEEEIDPMLISIEDCEKVHNAIDAPLDEFDPTEGSYTLNVSSVGADWTFRSERDYQKYTGELVDISLYEPINRKKNYVGKLVSHDDQTVTIQDKKEIVLPRVSIAKISRHVEF